MDPTDKFAYLYTPVRAAKEEERKGKRHIGRRVCLRHDLIGIDCGWLSW